MHLQFSQPQFAWLVLGPIFLCGWIFFRRARARAVTLFAAFLFLIAALMGPELGRSESFQSSQKADIVFAMDISRSMLAQDNSPSRLDLAKTFIGTLMASLPSWRSAIFAFTLDGYFACPFTTDWQAAKEALTALSPESTSQQGTNLDQALSTLFSRLDERKKNQGVLDARTVQVVLVSDGETHVDLGNSVLHRFHRVGIPILTLGAGTREGMTLPYLAGVSTHRPIHTKMNVELLMRVASETGGSYYPLHLDQVDSVAQRIRRSASYSSVKTRFRASHVLYPWLAVLSLLLFLVELLSRRWAYVLRVWPFAFILAGTASASTREWALQYNRGLERVSQSQVKEAWREFEAILQQPPSEVPAEIRKRAYIQLGNLSYQANDLVEAMRMYQQAMDTKANHVTVEKSLNQAVAQNLVHTRMLIEKAKRSGGGTGSNPAESASESKGKRFEKEHLSEDQKKKLLERVRAEEQAVMSRMSRTSSSREQNDKPW